ncbi:uncharacterized protein LOC119690639 isoform X2 [Plutella xylostella]|uniref:uncharacterized protein LOC119690639 isoform X2 n=1 Tax=Plutella xylostella TaxID=51655 RepID=UPI002032F1B1|nr:uncharacterized protein LOC119690639 isoform X2 [Plutella xylostella]
MGGTQRLAAVAAVSHARHYYNHTQPDVVQTENPQYGVSVFFVSATLCGVLVAVCAACWPRSRPLDKPDDTAPCPRGVYTVSADARTTLHVHQVREELPVPEPPPAYDTVVEDFTDKECHILREVVTEPCALCPPPAPRPDSGLPSYEAAVMLRDTKL